LAQLLRWLLQYVLFSRHKCEFVQLIYRLRSEWSWNFGRWALATKPASQLDKAFCFVCRNFTKAHRRARATQHSRKLVFWKIIADLKPITNAPITPFHDSLGKLQHPEKESRG
jgi:hypothetical protein